MAGSLNKVISLYESGLSIPDVARETGRAMSTVRYHIKKAGSLRTRAEGIRLARGKISAAHLGKPKPKSAAHRKALSDARLAWGDENARGTSVKPNGYVEYTRGEHKGRSVHVVTMEHRIGRRILPDEIVHHVDGNRSNNDPNNLALMTRSAHTRLHRREEKLSKGNM